MWHSLHEDQQTVRTWIAPRTLLPHVNEKIRFPKPVLIRLESKEGSASLLSFLFLTPLPPYLNSPSQPCLKKPIVLLGAPRKKDYCLLRASRGGAVTDTVACDVLKFPVLAVQTVT